MLPQEVLLTTGAARRDAGGIYMIYCAADAIRPKKKDKGE